MADVRLEVKGLKELQKKLVKEVVLQPFNEGIKKIVLALQREVMVATPVDTGRLRASVTPKLTEENGVFQGIVGTWVTYSPFIEYGHLARGGRSFVLARHVTEGSSVRVASKGMFAYGLEKVKEKLSKFLSDIGMAIEQRWNK